MTAREIPFTTVDAFTSKPFGGNPATSAALDSCSSAWPGYAAAYLRVQELELHLDVVCCVLGNGAELRIYSLEYRKEHRFGRLSAGLPLRSEQVVCSERSGNPAESRPNLCSFLYSRL
jgi:hypothetical protein